MKIVKNVFFTSLWPGVETRRGVVHSAPTELNSTAVRAELQCKQSHCNTVGDSDVISMLAGFRRHLVGKTLVNVFHCDVAENTLCWQASDYTDIS